MKLITISKYYFQGASFAVGNAAYHSPLLLTKLGSSIPALKTLLSDGSGKIRAHAASE